MATTNKSLARVYEGMSPVKRALFIIAVLFTNVYVCADFVLMPIADAMYAAFPDDPIAVDFIYTGPYLFIFGMSFLVPVLLRFMSKKTLLTITGVLYALCSIFGVLFLSIPWMIVTRMILGCCNACAQVCGMGLLADTFEDEAVRARFMGFFNMAMALLGAFMSYVAGILSVMEGKDWTYSFNAYWVAIIPIVLVVLFIPSVRQKTAAAAPSADGAGEPGELAAAGAKKGFGSQFWLMLIAFFLIDATYSIVYTYYISFYVAENALGDAAFTGTCMSANSIAGIVLCLVFGFLYKKFRSRTSLIFYAAVTVGIFLLYLAPSAPMLVFVSIVGGACFCGVFTYAYQEGSVLVSPDKCDRALGFVTGGYSLASFLIPYIYRGIQAIMNTDMLTPCLVVVGALAAVGFVVEVVRTIVMNPAKEDAVQKA